MESEAIKYIGVGLTSLGALGGAIGVGMIFSALLNGAARNPAVEGKLFQRAIIGAGFAEALGLFSLVLGIMILFVV